ncbi:MAG: transcriptional repressor [Oscillospiraceae bacterium]|nr:transcriptional repressor [Oscillospiraceae bacterium]
MEATKHFRKRDAILNCLRSTDVHPSAEWIHEQLKAEHSDISLATVYRNLARFKERGDIVSLGTVNGVERFDGNTNPHVHFICTSCSGVLDLHGVAVPQELNERVSGTGQVNSCQLTFTGKCNQCIKQEETA